MSGDFDRDDVLDLLQPGSRDLAAVSARPERRCGVPRSAIPTGRVVPRRHNPAGTSMPTRSTTCWFTSTTSIRSMSLLSPIQARDGSTGEPLWESELHAQNFAGMPLLDCRDLDRDGRPEVVLVSAMNLGYKTLNYSNQAVQLWLVVLQGSTAVSAGANH